METKKEKTKKEMWIITKKWEMWYKLNLNTEYKNSYDLNFLFLYYRVFDWLNKNYFLDSVDIKEIKKVYNQMLKDRKTWHGLNSKIKKYYRNRPHGLYVQKIFKENRMKSTTLGVHGKTEEAQT